MADATYQPKVYTKQGGEQFVVASGGSILIESGGQILDMNGNNMMRYLLTKDVADMSADASYFVVAPYAGKIKKVWTVIDGVVSTADITVTPKIATVAVTDGAVTIGTASSAAGDVDSATPSAANTVTAGQAIELVVAGGGSGGAPRGQIVLEIERT